MEAFYVSAYLNSNITGLSGNVNLSNNYYFMQMQSPLTSLMVGRQQGLWIVNIPKCDPCIYDISFNTLIKIGGH